MIDTAGGSTSAPAEDVAIPASSAPTQLNVPCPCPGSPHDWDVVTFAEHASLPMGQAASTVSRLYGDDEPVMQGELARVILRFGIIGWTFLGDDRRPIPVSSPVDALLIERWLPWTRGGFEAMEVANRLYGSEIFDPLVRRSRTLSLPGADPSSTSATNGSGSKHRTPSGRSSRTRSGAGKRSGGRAP